MPSLPRPTEYRTTEYQSTLVERKKRKIIPRQREPDILRRELGSHVTDIVNQLGRSGMTFVRVMVS